ncbi:MAG: hypothetical protein LBH32_03900 [Dysgonamonadaceae bacterium]|jgi:hypothetical protein|nr:hypothetical protein [Dysgonamonadaceae bacterium]
MLFNKLLTVIFAALFVFFLSSCGGKEEDDDAKEFLDAWLHDYAGYNEEDPEPENPVENLLLGTWRLVYYADEEDIHYEDYEEYWTFDVSGSFKIFRTGIVSETFNMYYQRGYGVDYPNMAIWNRDYPDRVIWFDITELSSTTMILEGFITDYETDIAAFTKAVFNRESIPTK